VSGAELSRWRSSWGEAAEAQWAAAGQGKYKESAAAFLVSTWQGDALMVRQRHIAKAVADLAMRIAAYLQPCCMSVVLPVHSWVQSSMRVVGRWSGAEC
jgi:hypothetical protein